MPSIRVHPLILAGAACLTLAACGSDDDPPAQADLPTTTEAAPAQTAPTATAPDAAADGADEAADAGGSGDSNADAPRAAADAAAADGDTSGGATGEPGASAKGSSARPSEREGTSKDQGTGSPASPDGKAAGSAPSAGGGDPDATAKDDAGASASETQKVRDALVALQEAFAAKDGAKACSYMIGIPEKSDPKSPGMSCESLSRGPKTTLSAENRKIAATAKVTVSGSTATAELGPGVPLSLRKIDGRWRVDYSQMVGGGRGSR